MSICVELEGYVERPVGDINVRGEWSSVHETLLVFKRPLDDGRFFIHSPVKSIIGDASDYSLFGVPLQFGAGASPIQCILDEQQCFYFEATQDDIKEEEEKFKLSLYTDDPGVCFCSDQAHVVIEEDDSDGEKGFYI